METEKFAKLEKLEIYKKMLNLIEVYYKNQKNTAFISLIDDINRFDDKYLLKRIKIDDLSELLNTTRKMFYALFVRDSETFYFRRVFCLEKVILKIEAELLTEKL